MRTIITLRPTKDGKTQVTRKQLFDRFVQRGGKRARDTYANGLHSKEDELIRKGYKKVGTGSNGWTVYYENDAGKRVTIKFGPQPGQIQSITKDEGRNYGALSELAEMYERDRITYSDLLRKARDIGFTESDVNAHLTDRMTSVEATSDEAEGTWSETYGPDGKKHKVWVPSKKSASESAGEAKDLFIGNRGLNWEREDRFTDKAYTGDRRRVVIHNHLPPRKAQDAQQYTDSELQMLGAKLLTRYNRSSEVREWAQRGKMTRLQEAFIVEGWKQARMEAGLSENT